MIEEEEDGLLSNDGGNSSNKHITELGHQSSYLLKKPHLTKNVEKIEEVDGEDEDMDMVSGDKNDQN